MNVNDKNTYKNQKKKNELNVTMRFGTSLGIGIVCC